MKKIKGAIKNIMEFGRDMSIHNSSIYAASVSFFFFLSIFPTLMFVCSLIPYLPITEGDLVKIVTDISPDTLDSILISIIDEIYRYASTLLPIAAITTLWTAGMGIMGLIRALNGIWGIEDKRNYFVLRGIATIYMLMLLLSILLSMILALFGKSIVEKIVSGIPEMDFVFELAIYLRGFFVWGILIVIFTLAYTYLPAGKRRLLFQIPGAIFASTAWCVMTWAFSLYIDYFGGFSIYGNLTTIVVILFWLYFCFTIVIIGAFINKYYRPLFNKGYDKAMDYRKKKRNK